jgi:cell division cycle 20-like protein 1 (cofactor of APC complex)
MPPQVEGTGGTIASSAKRPISSTQTPVVVNPSRAATPPPPSERRFSEARLSDYSRNGRTSLRSGDLNADAVDSALRREINRQQRESTPGSSPHRKRQRINGDRYGVLSQMYTPGCNVSNAMPDSFPVDQDRTCGLDIACCMRTDLPRRRPGKRSGLPTESCIFKRVSHRPRPRFFVPWTDMVS